MDQRRAHKRYLLPQSIEEKFSYKQKAGLKKEDMKDLLASTL